MILVYNGSFEGFLTLVYEVYYKKLNPEKILKQIPQILLMDEIITIEVDIQKATKVLDAIKTNFDKKNFELILNIFMCDTKEFEVELLKYIIVGFKDKNELFNINNSEVFFLQNLEKELFRSIHKMYGFTRFEELEDNTLYSKIDTKYNMVYFLGKHFFRRLNNQNFIIHDLKRELAFVKVGQKTSIEKVIDFKQPNLSENEEKFTKLWNRFFNAITIESRKNKKCQQNFVPFIYRTYMTEFL